MRGGVVREPPLLKELYKLNKLIFADGCLLLTTIEGLEWGRRSLSTREDIL